MHEMSIADAMLHIALDQARGRRIERLGIAIGHLRQVVPSSLRFSFELLAHDTPAAGAALEIEEVPAVGRCRVCNVESGMHDFPLHCAACGGLDVMVVRGEELSVEWIDVETQEPSAADGIETDAIPAMMNRG